MTDDNLIFQEDIIPLEAAIKSEIKKSIVIKPCSEHSHIYVLALNKFNNKLMSIVYKERSTPITGYVYDAKIGQYYVDCVNYLDLGIIPISFSIKIDKINRWECRIPLVESAIKKYLDKGQIAKLKVFKESHKNCQFDFMQLVSCY